MLCYSVGWVLILFSLKSGLGEEGLVSLRLWGVGGNGCCDLEIHRFLNGKEGVDSSFPLQCLALVKS